MRKLSFLFLFVLNFAFAAKPAIRLPEGIVMLPQGIAARADEVNLKGQINWGKYPPDYYWGDTTAIDLNNDPVLFLTHHSSVYDSEGVAEAGAKFSLDTFLDAGYPALYLYSFRFAGPETFRFLNYYSQFVGVESEGGENKLRYEGSRNFFFTGGHFSMCLCETIRDTLRNITDLSPTEVTHFYFVQDGIYDVGKSLKAHAEGAKTSGTTLAQLVDYKILAGEIGESQTHFCYQNWKGQPEVYAQDYSIQVENFDGTLIPISQGSKGSVAFHFVDSTQVDDLLEKAK